MKKFFVIGNPVKHSLSPLIFRYWFKKYKLKCTYEKIESNTSSFKQKASQLINMSDTFGLNITAPFKNITETIVDKKDIHAKKIGSINCVYKRNNKIIGTNTDWVGLIDSIKKNEKENKIKTKKEVAAIIGFGGAAKAVVYALDLLKFKKILVFVRNVEKFPEIQKTNLKINCFDIKNINNNSSNFDVVINTASTSTLSEIKIKTKLLKKTAVVFDINYNPHLTELLKSAKLNNKKIIYGIHMLLYQAAPSFNNWFGFFPEVNNELIDICINNIKK